MASAAAHADFGQLLYFFDSAHFIDYLEQYKSNAYTHHVEIFNGLRKPDNVRLDFGRLQWAEQAALIIFPARFKA